LDDIRRRLAEIDRQFDRNPAYYYKQSVSTAPLVFCAIGLIAGIIIQDHLPAQFWSRWVLLGFCTAILILSLIIYFFWPASETRKFYILPLLSTVIFVCLGAIRLASFNSAPPNDIRKLVSNEPNEPNLATIRGVIVTEPYIDGNDWQFSKFTPADRGSSFYLKLREAEATTGWVKVSGLVRVRVNEPILDLRTGNLIQIYCILNRFKGATNPGEFDMAKYMARNGVFVAGSVDSRQAIELLRNDAGLFTRIKAKLRKFAVNALLGGPYPQTQSESLLLALVLGHRTNIDKETYNAFRKTGLLHFVCLSGMNFAMVIGFVWWVCKTAGLMKPGRAIVCTITAAVFLMVVPENAPALRAAVICFAFCASFIFRRNSNSFNSLALAAIVLLLIKPTGIFQPDWQLSFASVLGILMFCPLFFSLLREKTIEHPWFTDFVKDRPFLHITTNSTPYSMFSTSFTAWLSTTGIILYHFYTFQWLTSIWTVLVSPLIGLVSLLGYLKLIVAIFLPSVSALMGVVINHLSDLLIWIVKLFAGLNISEILIGKTNIAVILLFYGLIVFTFFFRLRNPAIKKVICVTAALALVAMVMIPKWQRTHGSNLTVTILDVGHGQAILAQLPGGANILFDAGSLNRSDVGTRVVTPFLRYRGIGKIDAVIIGHGDIDHISGVPEVTGDTRTKAVYASKAFFEDKRQTTKFLRNKLRKIVEINDLPQKLGSSKIRVLWPIPDIQENNSISDNDKSVVTLIEYAGRRVLICSDIEKFAQREILRLYPDLKADVLILPHHGSAKTSEPSFVDKTGAAVTIASNSESSYEKGQVIGPRQGLKSYYTGKDGAVTIRINEQGAINTTAFTKEKQPAY
jgi:competence protein ComEC